MARNAKLPDKETMDRITSFIRGGAFPYVAAAAEGIPSTTFFRWMQLGKQGKKPYVGFWEKVVKAHSQKRVAAEVQVAKENPLAWLRLGPGRSRPGEPGLTDDPADLAGLEGMESNTDGFTDEERAHRVAHILNRARARRDGQVAEADPSAPVDPAAGSTDSGLPLPGG